MLMEKSLEPPPSASAIAKEAGVTKGVIYLYFDSKEEIHLTLMTQQSRQLFEILHTALASPAYNVDHFRDVFVNYCAKNDLRMYLGLAAPAFLESRVGVEFAREFKREVSDSIEELAIAWAKREPQLKMTTLRAFLLRIYHASLTEWQHFHPPEVILKAFVDRENWMLEGNFANSLTEMFDWLWEGMKVKNGVK